MLLDKIHELAQNGLCHLALNHSHVIYNGVEPCIVSVDGKNMAYNMSRSEREINIETMYVQFALLYLDLITKTVDISFLNEFSNDNFNSFNYCKAKELVKREKESCR